MEKKPPKHKEPIAKKLNKYLKILNPSPPIGGLSITDDAIRFVLIHEDRKISSASLRLPPGIISGGIIKDAANLKLAFKKLHEEIKIGKNHEMHIVVVLPSPVVSAQSFYVPFIEENRLDETAKLNMQMVSPIDWNTAYSSWQKIGEQFSEGGQIELLGAFAEKKLVDEYTSALEESGFSISAVEFPALSLLRLINHENILTTDGVYLIVEVMVEGVGLMLIKEKNLRFNHFHTWQSVSEEIGGKQITKEELRKFLETEIQKLINFNTSKWGGAIVSGVVISPGTESDIESIFKDSFSLPIIKFPKTSQSSSIEAPWFTAAGAALRGMIDREKDMLISLANTSVQEKYWETKKLHFAIFWRKISFVIVIFLLLLTAGFDFYIALRQKSIKNSTNIVSASESDIANVKSLEAKAKEFNKQISKIEQAGKNTNKIASLFKKIETLQKDSLIIKSLKTEGKTILISGHANTESEVISFKDSLEKEEEFKDVQLPLSNLHVNPSGGTDFSLTFSLVE